MQIETKELLKNYPLCVEQYFTYWIDEFMKTGKEPQLQTYELNRMWELLKVYEMSNYIQREGRYDTALRKKLKKQLDSMYQLFQNIENNTFLKNRVNLEKN